jgi:Tfp pilus assembly protein PilF
MTRLSPKFYSFTAIFFLTAVLVIVATQWIRQAKPEAIRSGWRFQVAVTLDRTGDLYHALEELQNALQEPESRQDALELLAAIERRKKKAKQMLINLRDEIGDDGLKFKRSRLYFSQGVVMELLQRENEARESFLESIRLKSRQSIAYVRLGLLYERAKMYQKSEQYFQEALSKNDPALLTHFHYGMFLARTGTKPETAKKMAEFIASSRPLYAEIIRRKLTRSGDIL